MKDVHVLCSLNLLEQQQRVLEADMHDAGLNGYRQAIGLTASDRSSSWDDHLLDVIGATAGAIEDARSRAQGGRATRKREAVRLLPPGLPSDHLALLTVRRAIDLLSLNEACKRSLGALIRLVAADVEGEAVRLDLAGLPEGKPWTVDQAHKVGGFLAECLFETNMLCTPCMIRDGKKKKHILELMPDLVEWLPTVRLGSNLLPPQNMPMIVPPLDWRQGQVGGYHTGAKLRNYSLVTPKYRFDPNAWKAADEAIQGDNTKRTLDAVNAMQRTSWRINQPALQIGKKLNDGCVPGAENKKLAKERTLNAAERFKNFDCVIRSIATPDSGRRRPGSGTH